MRAVSWAHTRLLAIPVWLVAVAGCSNVGNAAGSDDFAAAVDAAVERAVEHGAGPEQLALLDQARQRGSLTLEDIRSATQSAVECMEAAGLDARYEEHTVNGGVVYPTYSVGVSDGGTESSEIALIDRCDNQHLVGVVSLFSTQPSFIEEAQRYVLDREDGLRACLEAAGIATDPDANGLALAELAATVGERGGDPEAGRRCLRSEGIGSF